MRRTSRRGRSSGGGCPCAAAPCRSRNRCRPGSVRSATTESSIAMSTNCPRPVRSRASSASVMPCAANMPLTMSAMATPRRNCWSSRIAGDAHQAAFSLHHSIIASLALPRAGLSESGDRAVDQTRVRRRQRGVVKSQLGQRAGAEVLHDDVGARQQPVQDLPSFRVLEIEGDALLVAVDAQEIRALAVDERRVPSRACRRPCPGCSTLMTRAPMSPSIMEQYGPDSTRVRSRTVTP